jgi:cystathionine beta-lyase/cystathionine gamma-synthase
VKLPDHARFSTICIHAGQEPDPSTGAIITPIFQTSTYVQDELGRHKGYEYARTQNPTRATLERNIAAIEGGRAAFAFASGMAAIGAVGTMLKAGDHVVVTDNTYGGTFRLFDKVLTKFQLSFSYVDSSKPELIEQAMRPQTKLVFVETPTNPVLRLTDIARAAEIAHSRNARLLVDNTFASPCLQRPIELGADLVVHSTTKYLNAHSDSIGGIVVAVQDEDIDWLRFIQNAEGAILSPFDSWLVLRGTKTLALRMAQHNTNGMALAEFLAGHPAVTHVIYPGLPSHPQHDLARRQMRGFGGMVSFDVGTFENARRVCNRVRLMSLAESLGGVETLSCPPATMTLASVPPERRAAIGLTDSLVRISAGVEDPDDLIDDLRQALGSDRESSPLTEREPLATSRAQP